MVTGEKEKERELESEARRQLRYMEERKEGGRTSRGEKKEREGNIRNGYYTYVT